MEQLIRLLEDDKLNKNIKNIEFLISDDMIQITYRDGGINYISINN